MIKRKQTLGIIVHHTVTPSNITPEKLRAIFKARFGVNYIGYNYYIQNNGQVHSDIGADAIGIHNNQGRLQNINSCGVALAGDFEKEEPSALQLQALSRLLTDLLRKYQLQSKDIYGHRDFKKTACPGKNLYKYKPFLIEEPKEDYVNLTPEQVKEFYQIYLKREAENEQMTKGRTDIEFLKNAIAEIWQRYDARQDQLQKEIKSITENLNAVISTREKEIIALKEEIEGLKKHQKKESEKIFNQKEEIISRLEKRLSEVTRASPRGEKAEKVSDTTFVFLNFLKRILELIKNLFKNKNLKN